jgi:hypothetical protein
MSDFIHDKTAMGFQQTLFACLDWWEWVQSHFSDLASALPSRPCARRARPVEADSFYNSIGSFNGKCEDQHIYWSMDDTP